jgi:UDP-N-acetylglucosamine 2-epimerase (non-hydrolysing)
MVDALIAMRDKMAAAPGRYLPDDLPRGPYLLATVHRQETTDDPGRLAATLKALAGCPLPVTLLAHPRLRDRAGRLGLPLDAGSLRAAEPLPCRGPGRPGPRPAPTETAPRRGAWPTASARGQ